jgi:hypothetical protein
LIVAVRDRRSRWRALLESYPRARPLGGASSDRLFAIDAAPSLARREYERVRLAGATSNVTVMSLADLQDGNLVTAFHTPTTQRGGEELRIDLESAATIDGVSLALGPYFSDAPIALTIETRDESGSWAACWDGPALGYALTAAFKDRERVELTIPCHGRATAVRVRQTGENPKNGWAVAELAVLTEVARGRRQEVGGGTQER